MFESKRTHETDWIDKQSTDGGVVQIEERAYKDWKNPFQICLTNYLVRYGSPSNITHVILNIPIHE